MITNKWLLREPWVLVKIRYGLSLRRNENA